MAKKASNTSCMFSSVKSPNTAPFEKLISLLSWLVSGCWGEHQHRLAQHHVASSWRGQDEPSNDVAERILDILSIASDMIRYINYIIVIDRYSADHHRSRFKAQSCHGHSWPKSHFDTADIDSGKTWCDVFVMSSSWHLEIQLGACYTLWAHGPPITLLAYVRGSDFNWFSCPGLKNTTWRTHENKNSRNKQPVLQAAFFVSTLKVHFSLLQYFVVFLLEVTPQICLYIEASIRT